MEVNPRPVRPCEPRVPRSDAEKQALQKPASILVRMAPNHRRPHASSVSPPFRPRRLAGMAVPALAWLLMGSECRQEVSFPEASPEVCNNLEDDDEDGRIDCADSECSLECQPSITLYPVLSPTAVDSQTIGGTRAHVQSITVSLEPPLASPGAVQMTDGAWSILLRGLAEGSNAITVIAADSLDRRDTAKGEIVYTRPPFPVDTAAVDTTAADSVGSTPEP